MVDEKMENMPIALLDLLEMIYPQVNEAERMHMHIILEAFRNAGFKRVSDCNEGLIISEFLSIPNYAENAESIFHTPIHEEDSQYSRKKRRTM